MYVKLMRAKTDGRAPWMEQRLESVRHLMAETLANSPLKPLIMDSRDLLINGKMLRARLAVRVGPAAGVSEKIVLHAAAAVELIHAASLLHDDVIDEGYLRRGLPAFWVERGISGAILLGDLMLFKALDLIAQVDDGRMLPNAITLTGEVCEAESEQELMLRGKVPDWPTCVDISRRKTGALFAFIALISGGKDQALCEALREAGYGIGTAYQLADDLLDVNGTTEAAGKTLGRDEARREVTAARAELPVGFDPVAFIENLCEVARERLAPWLAVREAWDDYMNYDMRPILERNMQLTARR